MGNFSHFIKGAWLPGEGAPLTSLNPATNTPVFEGRVATQEELQRAVLGAKEAQPSWFELGLEKRQEALLSLKQAFERGEKSLAEAISLEVGKPLWEAKTEVAALLGKIALSIEAFNERCPSRTQEINAGTLTTLHKPHGVAAVLGPFNFPAHLPHGHIVPALLAGNTVVFKGSKKTPLVSATLMQCYAEGGLPPGVINMVQGDNQTAQSLAEDAGVDALFFTGSYEVGVGLQKSYATKSGKILALEMGGNNPLVVDDPDDVELAAYNTILSAFITSGQRCTCARRLIVVTSKNYQAFIETLVGMMGSIQVGPPTQRPEPFMGPLIDEVAALNVMKTQEHLLAKGANSLVRAALRLPSLVSPGLIDVTSLNTQEDKECFGPLLQLIKVPTFEAALKEANNTSYGLSAGFIGQDPKKWETFTKQVRAGVINWNLPITGASGNAPFGGVGKSGNFRPSAYYAADYCAYPVASMQTPFQKLPHKLLPGVQLLARS